jgi:type IV pilus assembly protein PilE
MMTPEPVGGRTRCAGLTLIEVMIVVVIIGIISAIAFPVYDRYTTESRRSEARSALTRIATQQAEYVLNHSVYASDVTSLGFDATSENGYYTLEITAASGAVSYTAAATAAGVQAGDSRCATFRITHTGARVALTSGNSDSTADCW